MVDKGVKIFFAITMLIIIILGFFPEAYDYLEAHARQIEEFKIKCIVIFIFGMSIILAVLAIKKALRRIDRAVKAYEKSPEMNEKDI